MKAKKSKLLFRARKVIPAKVCWAVVLGLMIALGILVSIPFRLGIPFVKMAIWILTPSVLLNVMIAFPVYSRHLKKENRRNAEVENMQKSYDSLKREVEHLRNRVASFDEEIAIERNKRQVADREKEAVLKDNDLMKNYKQMLKELYLCSKSASARAYAEECFRHKDGLDLFHPVRYLQDTSYARVIELHADELIQILQKPKDIFGMDGTYETRKYLNSLLKKSGTSTPTFSRDTQPLKRINNETEL